MSDLIKLQRAIVEAMEDFFDGNDFTKVNPAIMHGSNYYYGSTLHGDTVIMDLTEGFGSWTPGKLSDIPSAAYGLAKEILI